MSKARKKRKIERAIKQEAEIRKNVREKIKQGKIKTKSKKKVVISIIIAIVVIAAALIIIFVKSGGNTIGNNIVPNNGGNINPNAGNDNSAIDNSAVINTKEAALAKCLTEKGVIFYGASWCPHCANQKKAFGDGAKYLPYVECTDVALQQKCVDAEVTSIPDWRINGQKYLGERSLENLASYSGCVY